jgi:dCMP deaminase
MNIAQLVATRATCNRGSDLKYLPGFKGVGAVIVRDKVILATGYNGSPRGLDHCDEAGHEISDGHCIRTVHAEANALAAAAKNGVAINGATIYTTASPCYDCFKLLVNAGIERIFCGAFYGSRYGASEKVIAMAAQAGVKFEFMKPESQESLGSSLGLKIKKIHPLAQVPSYAHVGDAGLDLYAVEGGEIAPFSRAKFGTGISLEIPEGYVGLIWDRSGLSTKKGLKSLGGVVDSIYRGEVLVALANISDEPVQIMQGDRVAQILIQKVESVSVEVVDELADSERGENGFGSTDEVTQIKELAKEEKVTEKTEDKEGQNGSKGRW